MSEETIKLVEKMAGAFRLLKELQATVTRYHDIMVATKRGGSYTAELDLSLDHDMILPRIPAEFRATITIVGALPHLDWDDCSEEKVRALLCSALMHISREVEKEAYKILKGHNGGD